MKYYETLIEDQETTISILYDEQTIKLYSSEPQTIKKLLKVLGRPNVNYKKSKTYWSGASWNISFFDNEKINALLVKNIFVDEKIKPKVEGKKKSSAVKTKIEKTEKAKTEKKNTKTKKIENIKKDTKIKKVENTKNANNFEQIKIF